MARGRGIVQPKASRSRHR